MTKILVYDEDSKFREVMQAALMSLGYETVFAVDGYSVLPLAQQHRPRLIILDYKLPAAEGFQILLRLRKATVCAFMPVIFASVTPKFEIEMIVMDTISVGYVDKPLNVQQLKEAIVALIGPNSAAAVPPSPGAPLPPPVFTGEPDLDGIRDDIIELD